MTQPLGPPANTEARSAAYRAADLLGRIPPARRPAVLTACLAALPCQSLEESFDLGPVRAALSEVWETTTGESIPFGLLRSLLTGVDVRRWTILGATMTAPGTEAIAGILQQLPAQLVPHVRP